jgi:hypothetical protein
MFLNLTYCFSQKSGLYRVSQPMRYGATVKGGIKNLTNNRARK